MRAGTRTTLFRNGAGYLRVRIPAIVQSGDGALTVLAVGRRRVSDWGRSDILGRRSLDGGVTWSPVEVLIPGGRHTVDNPTLVAEPGGTRVHLLYQVDYRRLLHRVSLDGGATFEPASDLTGLLATVRRRDGFAATVVAPGPGAGAVLPDGRVVVPLWVAAARGRAHRPSATLTIHSDDAGTTWSAGELVAAPGGALRDPSEAAIAVVGSTAVLGIRHETSRMRAMSRSADGATGWSEPELVPDLYDPICHASLAAVGETLYFANPDSRAHAAPPRRDGKGARRGMALRASPDLGRTWGERLVVEVGPSAYSAMAADRDGTALHLVYEGGALRSDPLGSAWIGYRRIAL